MVENKYDYEVRDTSCAYEERAMKVWDPLLHICTQLQIVSSAFLEYHYRRSNCKFTTAKQNGSIEDSSHCHPLRQYNYDR